MKKSIIAMAVAGALAVPAIASADATLYGSLRLAMQDVKGDSLALNDQASRIGIKGTVDLGLEDTKGLFQLEESVNLNTGGIANGGRLGIIGATGSWGTVLGGRFNHPSVSMVTDYADTSYSGRYANIGAQYHDKQGNTLAYASPVMSGVQVVVGGVFAGDALSDGEKDKQVDGYNIGVKYDENDIYAAIAYGNVKSEKSAVDGSYGVDQNVWGLAVGYTGVENLELKANYSRLKDKTGTSTVIGERLLDVVQLEDPTADFDSGKATAYNLAAKYHIDATHVYAGYGRTKYTATDAITAESGSTTVSNHYVGVGQTLGRGAVFAQYENSRGDLKATESARTVSLGYRVSF